MFFAENGNFNVGNIHGFNEDQVIAAMEQAETKIEETNTEGLKLQQEFSYKKSLDTILKHMDTNNG